MAFAATLVHKHFDPIQAAGVSKNQDFGTLTQMVLT